jgi:hypothetical protein
MKTPPPVDRRDSFAAAPRSTQGDPDLVITLREPHARWRAVHRVILSNGDVAEVPHE